MSLRLSDIDILSVVKHAIVPRKEARAILDVNPSNGWWWEHSWAYNGPYQPAGDPGARQPASSNHPFWLGRASALNAADQLGIAGGAHVEVYDDTRVVDQRSSQAPVDAWRVDEREPTLAEWLLYEAWEPVRSIGAARDPLLTWEWRVHLGQPATTPATIESDAIDDLLVLHNLAVFEGATDRADLLRERIERRLDRRALARFDQGVELIGVGVTRGAGPRVEALVPRVGSPEADAALEIRSTVEARARMTLIPPDSTDREVAVVAHQALAPGLSLHDRDRSRPPDRGGAIRGHLGGQRPAAKARRAGGDHAHRAPLSRAAFTT
jgi:hypothetical protein